MTNPTWQQVDKGRYHLQMNGHDLQVIRNPDRDDHRRRFLAVVNRRPLDPPTQTAGQAKQKAINYVFGVNRKPRGQTWDWSQVRPANELEAELDAARQDPIPGTGPQPDVQPEAQAVPDLTDDQADAVLDAIFHDVVPDQAALPAPDPVAPLGTVHEVTVEFKAVFRTADPEAVVSQLRVYIQSLRQDLGGDVDCKVNQPPCFRI